VERMGKVGFQNVLLGKVEVNMNKMVVTVVVEEEEQMEASYTL
jgi:hypothetical protein